MEAFLDGLPCGIATFAGDGTLLAVNLAFADLAGRPPEALIGQRIDALLGVPARVFFQTHLFPLLKMAGRVDEAHFAVRGPEGDVPVLFNGVRTERDGRTVVDGVFVAMHRRTRYEEEILAAKRATEAANAEKDRANAELQALRDDLERRVDERTRALVAANEEMEGFTYSIAHDLRAPLRAIASTAAILLEDVGDGLDDASRALLRRQGGNAVKLGRLIDDLLRFSQLARAGVRRAAVDVTAVAEEAVAELRAAGMAGRVGFEVAPGMVADADPALLGQLYTNLLDNAAKFSPQGGRVVAASHRLGGETVFTVRDEGVGFDMRFAEKLFQPFQRLVGEGEFEGTGIGLANVRRIVVRHGGRVWADSALGRGATFSFTLA